MKNRKIISNYWNHLINVEDAAVNTAKAYTRAVNLLREHTEDKPLKRINKDDVISFRQALTGAPNTINMRIRGIRSFFDWMVDENKIERNPVPRKLKVKTKKQAPYVPSAQQFVAMRNKLESKQRYTGVDKVTRRAVFETMAGSGLRISDLLSLRASDLKLGDKPYIAVNAEHMQVKGHFAGHVPITSYAAACLKQYLSYKGIGGKLFNVSESWVRSFLNGLAPEGCKISPHTLRHFYCSMTYFRNFEGNSYDAVWVRDAVGHSSIQTTDKYLRSAQLVCSSMDEWAAWYCGSKLNEDTACSTA